MRAIGRPAEANKRGWFILNHAVRDYYPPQSSEKRASWALPEWLVNAGLQTPVSCTPNLDRLVIRL